MKLGRRLILRIALVMFVALNEKKKLVTTMMLFFDMARLWESLSRSN
jgi:hypothetical protein